MPRTRYNLSYSKVLDTRTSKNGLTIRRRRKCEKTGRRFTTIEQIIREGLFVIKRDGHREPSARGGIFQCEVDGRTQVRGNVRVGVRYQSQQVVERV